DISTDDTQEADQEDYRGKLNATNHFLKKEGYEFKGGKWVKKPATPASEQTAPSQDNLSQKDMFALIKADVHEDDISEVADYAKLKGITVAEALKAPVVKTILSE